MTERDRVDHWHQAGEDSQDGGASPINQASHPVACPGALPVAGPPHLIATDPAEAIRLADAPVPYATLTWWHQTERRRVDDILRYGLVPGCWIGHDTCVVFGIDELPGPGAQVGARMGSDPVFVEVNSPAPPGDVKALWVPSEAIRGFWHNGRFEPRRSTAGNPSGNPSAAGETPRRAGAGPDPQGCSCDMDSFSRALQRQWRSTLPNQAP